MTHTEATTLVTMMNSLSADGGRFSVIDIGGGEYGIQTPNRCRIGTQFWVEMGTLQAMLAHPEGYNWHLLGPDEAALVAPRFR